ncbi:MAG: hypothetical protein LBT56_00060 [Prevotellaceae bacterium]|jgi:hypothetical protein|nr:hypothetical protein [Prevotellaceae bacterium]
MEVKKHLKGEATEAQIALWKEKYGDIFQVVIEDKTCYLHKPDRKTLSAAATLGQTDPMRYNEVVINNCWIDGADEFKNDDSYFFALSEKLIELVELKTAEIKKL